MPTVKTEYIDFPSDARTTPGYLARPDDDKPHPGVVVIQEFWGLVPHIQDVAERFAREGYVALAPDLYHGQKAKEPDEARKLSMALDRARAVAEIDAAAAYLGGLNSVSPKKVGVVGWCMGGGLALSTAAQDAGKNIAAVVAFYGRPLAAEDTAKLRVPMLGLYGEKDHGIPVEAVRQFEKELDQSQVPHEIHIYPGAGHAFFNETRPQAYMPQAAEDAWKRTLGWFAKHVKKM